MVDEGHLERLHHLEPAGRDQAARHHARFVFMGYNPTPPAPGTSFATGDDLVLGEGDLSNAAMGLLASEITSDWPS